MSDLICRGLLSVAGLGFLGFGLAGLLMPQSTLAMAGVAASGPQGVVELRAMYGGLELGLGALLLAAAIRPAWHRPGLWLCLASYGGLALARGAGMLIEHTASPFLWLALGVELVFALLAGALLRRSH